MPSGRKAPSPFAIVADMKSYQIGYKAGFIAGKAKERRASQRRASRGTKSPSKRTVRELRKRMLQIGYVKPKTAEEQQKERTKRLRRSMLKIGYVKPNGHSGKNKKSKARAPFNAAAFLADASKQIAEVFRKEGAAPSQYVLEDEAKQINKAYGLLHSAKDRNDWIHKTESLIAQHTLKPTQRLEARFEEIINRHENAARLAGEIEDQVP